MGGCTSEEGGIVAAIVHCLLQLTPPPPPPPPPPPCTHQLLPRGCGVDPVLRCRCQLSIEPPLRLQRFAQRICVPSQQWGCVGGSRGRARHALARPLHRWRSLDTALTCPQRGIHHVPQVLVQHKPGWVFCCVGFHRWLRVPLGASPRRPPGSPQVPLQRALAAGQQAMQGGRVCVGIKGHWLRLLECWQRISIGDGGNLVRRLRGEPQRTLTQVPCVQVLFAA